MIQLPDSAAQTAPRFDWREALQVGFVESTAPQPAAPAPVTGGAGAAQGMLQNMAIMEASFTGDAGEDSFHLVVYPANRFFDGRLANRTWLPELPDPISKFCWSSWVEINPTVADRLRRTSKPTILVVNKADNDRLEGEGVDLAFGIPGGAILPAYDPLIESKVRHVLCRHEQGADDAVQIHAFRCSSVEKSRTGFG